MSFVPPLRVEFMETSKDDKVHHCIGFVSACQCTNEKSAVLTLTKSVCLHIVACRPHGIGNVLHIQRGLRCLKSSVGCGSRILLGKTSSMTCNASSSPPDLSGVFNCVSLIPGTLRR